MSYQQKSGLERVLDELKDPLDWACAFLGGAAGAAATVGLHGLDLGHAIPTGALTAIGARRTWSASRRFKTMIGRADNLSVVMKKNHRAPDLIRRLDYAVEKAKSNAITPDDFQAELSDIEEEDKRQR